VVIDGPVKINFGFLCGTTEIYHLGDVIPICEANIQFDGVVPAPMGKRKRKELEVAEVKEVKDTLVCDSTVSPAEQGDPFNPCRGQPCVECLAIDKCQYCNDDKKFLGFAIILFAFFPPFHIVVCCSSPSFFLLTRSRYPFFVCFLFLYYCYLFHHFYSCYPSPFCVGGSCVPKTQTCPLEHRAPILDVTLCPYCVAHGCEECIGDFNCVWCEARIFGKGLKFLFCSCSSFFRGLSVSLLFLWVFLFGCDSSDHFGWFLSPNLKANKVCFTLLFFVFFH